MRLAIIGLVLAMAFPASAEEIRRGAYRPTTVICISADGTEGACDSNAAAFSGVTNMPVDGTPYTAGRSVQAECTAAGNIKFTFTDASQRTVPVQIGLNILPYAVTTWTTSGVTGPATCTFGNLK